MIKLGIISFAHMHAFSYANAINSMPGVELLGITDDDKNRGTEAAKQFNTKFYDTVDELLKTDIDGVVICSENSNHVCHVLNSAKNKKHILCEKPIATNLTDAKLMIDVCSEAGVKFEIAFPCRFHPSITRLKEIISSGDLGDIMAIKSTNHGQMPDGWFIDKDKAGGGAVMDHTVHVVDLIRWFLGEEVQKVYAESGTLLHDTNIDDCGLLTLQFGDKVFTTLDTSWSRPKSFPTWGDLTMEVVGSKGVANLDMFGQNVVVSESGTLTTRYENWGSDSDYLLVKDFVDAISEDKDPLVSGYDGYKALEVALTAYKSIETGEQIEI